MLVSRFVSPARITYNNVSMWKNHLFPENRDRSTYGASQTRNARDLARIPLPSFVPCFSLFQKPRGINPRGKEKLRSIRWTRRGTIGEARRFHSNAG